MGVKGNLAIWEAESEGLELQSDLTINDIFDRRVEADPDKEALVYNYPELGIDLRLNFRQYRDHVDRLAKSLLALGVQKGDHLGMWAANLPEWIFLQFACARLGAVMVTINTGYKAGELEYVLRQGDVKMLFMAAEYRGNSYINSVNSIVPELKELTDPLHEELHSQALPRLKRVVLLGNNPSPGMVLYDDLVKLAQSVTDEQLNQRKAQVGPQDVFIILYTSGTTGFPKGAMLTHYNVLNTMIMNIRGQKYDQERYINPMPFFHVAGCNFNIFAVLESVTNIPVIAFDPIKMLQLFEQERGTMSFAVPTMLLAMMNHPRFVAGEFHLQPIRLIYSGGTTVPAAVLEQVKQKLNGDVGILFGMTESTGAGTSTIASDDFALKSTTVGKPYPNMEIKIVKSPDGEAVEIGQSGELWMRGYAVMKGYYNMPEKTAETIDEDGWLHTGDLATMDERGYIRIIGRLKDMIIRGGENVYPAEIEAFLARHPAIGDAQVIGIPDNVMGEEIAALVRLKPGQDVTEDDIRTYCREGISRFKVPRYIRFVSEYPLTASGKIKKYELKQQLLNEMQPVAD